MVGREKTAHPRKKSGLCMVGDRKAGSATKEEIVLHVQPADQKRDQPRERRHHSRPADDQEEVQPSGHEQEIDQSGKEHEGAADHQHPRPAAGVDHQAQQEEEDKEGAGIEGIEPGQHQSEDGQRHGRGVQLP